MEDLGSILTAVSELPLAGSWQQSAGTLGTIFKLFQHLCKIFGPVTWAVCSAANEWSESEFAQVWMRNFAGVPFAEILFIGRDLGRFLRGRARFGSGITCLFNFVKK